MGEPIFDKFGNLIGELSDGIVSAGLTGIEGGLLGCFATVFLIPVAIILGIIWVSPFAAIMGIFSKKIPVWGKFLLVVYLAIYFFVAWELIVDFPGRQPFVWER